MRGLDLPRYDLSILRGDSFVSDQFFYPENIAPDAQLWQIEEGIADGSVRLKNWQEFTIQADVHRDGELWFSLTEHIVYNETNDRFWFALSAEQTRALASGSGVYDLQICKDGHVQTILYGSVELIPDITDTSC